MNRFEYENSLRDLFGAPWLQIKNMLPEDGELHGFNKVSQALDVSHVNLARYMQAAEYAIREVIATQNQNPSQHQRDSMRGSRLHLIAKFAIPYSIGARNGLHFLSLTIKPTCAFLTMRMPRSPWGPRNLNFAKRNPSES